MSQARERWTFTMELPAHLGDRGGRFVARLLKHLLRSWGVKCVAVLDESHQAAQAARSATQPAGKPTNDENALETQ